MSMIGCLSFRATYVQGRHDGVGDLTTCLTRLPVGHTLVREPPGDYLVGVGGVALPGDGDIMHVAELAEMSVKIHPVGHDEGHAREFSAEPVTDFPGGQPEDGPGA